MAPLDKTVFIDPLDVSEFIPSSTDSIGGFTQDVIDILGNAGDPSDGFDALLAGAGALVDAWDQASAAQDADLDALLALQGSTDPAPLDNSFADFQSSFAAGDSIVSAGYATNLPGIGFFPVNSNFANGIPAAPKENSLDLGVLHLNSAPVSYEVGVAVQIGNQYSGITDFGQTTGKSSQWTLNYDEKDSASGNQHFSFSFTFHPTALGDFTAQFQWFDAVGDYQEELLDVHVKVIP